MPHDDAPISRSAVDHALIFATMLLAACGDGTGPDVQDGHVSIPLCGRPVPPWIAQRNEGEEWIRLHPQGSSIDFDATPRVTLAYVEDGGQFSRLTIVSATAEQFDRVECQTSTRPIASKQLSGSVAGLGPGQRARVDFGGRTVEVLPDQPIFEFTDVRGGPFDLVAVRYPESSLSIVPDRIILRRNLDLPSGSVLATLNFDGAESFAPEVRSLTVTDAAGDRAAVLLHFFSDVGGSLLLNRQSAELTEVEADGLPWIPVSRQAAGDFHRVQVTVADAPVWFDESFPFLQDERFDHYLGAPADLSLQASPVLEAPVYEETLTTATTLVRVEIDPVLEPEVLATAHYLNGKSVIVRATREYFGDTQERWALEIPDLSGIPGFDPQWGLIPGETYNRQLVVSRQSEGLLLGRPVRDGDWARHITIRGRFSGNYSSRPVMTLLW